MKGFVPLSFVLWITFIGLALGEEPPKVEHAKHSYNTANSIGSTAKPDLLNYQHFGKYQPQPEPTLFQQRYQARTQQLQQTVPYNHQPEPARKPFAIGHHQTPIAMVIIAQPAYIPASMLQNGNVAQQLLQYFQGGNNQFKYQYVPANHQPFYQAEQPPQPFAHYQQEEPEYSPAPQAQTSQFYPHEALPAPQALVSPAQPQPMDFQPQRLQQLDEQQPSQDGESPDFSQLAQQAAQHFISSGGLNSGGRTAPAIITGLEHFSPEQQEKIKKQLSAHFGSPLKPLSLGQEGGSRQTQDKRLRTQKFVPSIQVKDGEITQGSKM